MLPLEQDGGGRGGAHYECINTCMIFESTYELF